MKNNVSATNKSKHNIFTRLTLIIVLGTVVLLLLSTLATTGIVAIIAQYWTVQDNNQLLLYSLVTMGISIVIGFGLSFGFSAIMVKTSQPYLNAFHRITEFDFSVRIKDNQIMSNLGLAESINTMAEQLGSVETLRDGFVSDFSHEFKTPIVSIAGFATLLKDKNLSEDERNEYLDVIIDESHRLVELSESVLMLSRLDSQTIINENYLLDEQLRQCMLLFSRQCSQKNITLEADFDDEIPIYSCKKLVSQVWVNLLSNAVKFTPANGTITVAAKRLANNSIAVSVADSGCGMSKETQSKIFIKFFQGDKSRTTAGNGLGLSVVKKICDLLSLDISVESELTKGSKFTVIIPVKR